MHLNHETSCCRFIPEVVFVEVFLKKFCHNTFYRAFFGSLYRCLARGARAVFQIYPENLAQRELILGFAMRAGFAGGIVVDYPHRYLRVTLDLLFIDEKDD